MKMYEISEKDIAMLEDVVLYFEHHYQNLTPGQDYMLDQLKDVVGRLHDIFSGYADDDVVEVTNDEIDVIIENNISGKYIAYDKYNDNWIAFDNWNCDGYFVETFNTRELAVDWLSDY